MPRQYDTFEWKDEEDYHGEATISYGKWDNNKWPDDGVSLRIEGGYMDEETIAAFQRWLKIAFSQAKRKHKEALDT